MTDTENENLVSIDADQIEWISEAWTTSDGRHFPAEPMFEKELALAALLANDVIFVNDHWWEKEWPEEARKMTSLNVNCNDVFAWGCADAEEMPFREIENVYRMWRKDPIWGSAIWCMIKRGQMPQKPVEAAIRKAGIWDLDTLPLKANWQDAEVAAFFKSFAQSQVKP